MGQYHDNFLRNLRDAPTPEFAEHLWQDLCELEGAAVPTNAALKGNSKNGKRQFSAGRVGAMKELNLLYDSRVSPMRGVCHKPSKQPRAGSLVFGIAIIIAILLGSLLVYASLFTSPQHTTTAWMPTASQSAGETSAVLCYALLESETLAVFRQPSSADAVIYPASELISERSQDSGSEPGTRVQPLLLSIFSGQEIEGEGWYLIRTQSVADPNRVIEGWVKDDANLSIHCPKPTRQIEQCFGEINRPQKLYREADRNSRGVFYAREGMSATILQDLSDEAGWLYVRVLVVSNVSFEGWAPSEAIVRTFCVGESSLPS